jgi:hypothetical protein
VDLDFRELHRNSILQVGRESNSNRQVRLDQFLGLGGVCEGK